MSTNKTTNYGLHSWEPSDDFLLAEVNENFAALDAVLGEKVVFGAYKGDGAKIRQITLGRPIKAVFLCRADGDFGSSSYLRNGMAAPGHPLGNSSAVVLQGNTMVIDCSNSNVSLNYSGTVYYYLAVL